MAILAGGAALRESVTIDEVAHVGAGVSALQRLDMRLNFEHPPLAKVLAAVPLVLRGERADYSHISWSDSLSFGGFGSMLGEWVFGHWVITRWNDPQTTLAWARLPMLLVTLALGLVIFRYASWLTDGRGGLLCLSLFVSTPAFLAFGPLVLTDIVVTLFSLITLWTLAEMWRSGSRASVVRFGCTLAGALLSKFSSGLLLIVCVAYPLTLRWLPIGQDDPASSGPIPRSRGWRNTGKGILLAAAIVYVVYLILSWNQPTSGLPGLSTMPAALRRLLLPPYLYGVGLAAFAFLASRGTFILGHAYAHGVWFYFPILFVLKSTLAFLATVLLALAAAIIAKHRVPRAPVLSKGSELHWRVLWVGLVVFTFACMASRLNLSIRHFMVPLVLLILLLPPLPRLLELLKIPRWIPAILAAASLITVIRAYPYYIPFLNSLSFGQPGYLLVNDSNLDWNQALPDVRRFVDGRGIGTFLIDEYGFSDPTAYLPQARVWICQQPAAADAGQWAVVSANMIAESHNCLWLLQYPHERLAGGSMYAFRLPAEIPSVGAPGGPPRRADWHNFAGMPAPWPDIRLIFLEAIRNPEQFPEIMRQMASLGGSGPP
jgi:hypothetical protein